MTKLKLKILQLKNSKCDKTQKIKTSNCDKPQNLKFWPNSKTQILTKLKNSNCDKTVILKGFAYTERLWNFFECKTMLWKKCWSFLLQIFIILSDIEEFTIWFSDFLHFMVQRWLNRFVYITTNCSCCPLNCLSVPAKIPICSVGTLCPPAPRPPAPQRLPLACQAASRLASSLARLASCLALPYTSITG